MHQKWALTEGTKNNEIRRCTVRTLLSTGSRFRNCILRFQPSSVLEKINRSCRRKRRHDVTPGWLRPQGGKRGYSRTQGSDFSCSSFPQANHAKRKHLSARNTCLPGL